jgi:hypothetical protein
VAGIELEFMKGTVNDLETHRNDKSARDCTEAFKNLRAVFNLELS